MTHLTPMTRALTDALQVTAQIRPQDVAALATRGVRALINNRPDGEEPGQPTSAELAEAADAAGLAYRHLPVVSGQLEDAQALAFGQALAELPAPVLAFCRTGTRSTMLWALQAASRQDNATILARAAAAGYDLAGFAPRLDAFRSR